jgi:hypothetical protein
MPRLPPSSRPRRSCISRSLKLGALYFGLVFAAGFALGAARVVWIVPRVGERVAELLEMPVMLAVTVLAARWVAGRLGEPRTRGVLVGVGCVGLALLLSAELTLVLWVRKLSLPEYLAGRDAVSGAAYLLMLGLFALMPLLVARRA